MIDLNQVMVFTRVIEFGSFAGASRALGMPRATVSRKVSQLEAALGVRLLQRSTRKLSLTDVGRDYYLKCSDALTEIDTANHAVSTTQQSPSGLLRIAAPLSAQSGFMNAWINDFLEQYPNVYAELLLSDEIVNLIESGIDVAFRAGKLHDSSLVARRLGRTKLVLCATPGYLNNAPKLKHLKDLKQHSCIAFSAAKGKTSWKMRGKKGQRTVQLDPRITVNSMEFALNSCLQGMGLALLPVGLIAEYIASKELQIVMRDYASEVDGFYLIYPSKQHLSVTVRAFLDFMIGKAESGLPWDALL